MSAPREVWVVVDRHGVPERAWDDERDGEVSRLAHDGFDHHYGPHTVHRYTLPTAPALTAGEREAVAAAQSRFWHSDKPRDADYADTLRSLLARCDTSVDV